MSGKFPMSQPDWENVDVIQKNTLAPRSYFFLYETEAAALAADADRSCSVKLSGTWKFHHATNPFEAPEGFEAVTFDTSKWANIEVPGMWQLQGFGHPHYTNVVYPWFVDPPNVQHDNNQTGSYTRKFTVPKAFRDQQLRLRFEGVDSAFHVFINGKGIGYSQGARNPSEFDITSAVNVDGENILAVRVYQYCDGTYLEDQDQWWLNGIYRDVYLHAFPKSQIQDVHVQTLLDDQYRDAVLQVNVKTEGSGVIKLKLQDASGEVIATDTKQAGDAPIIFRLSVSNPEKWSAESPYLYSIILSYGDRFLVQRVGFRRIEIKDGIYLINGNRIVFRGANRHEHHPKFGRAVPYEFMKNDLLIMKKHNLNAIRTCHQPSDPRMYDLADELGFWVMDEADLECHGFSVIDEAALPYPEKTWSFEKKKALVYDKSGRFTSDNPVWKDQYVDRALQLCMRDKNHACVIMWSLGNEAFYGRNFQSMYDEIKSHDQTRPIHYEGDFNAETVDLYSKMYPQIDDIIEFAEEPNFTKPLVLCEFVHAMGNGPGNIKEYIDAFYKYPRLQGGWVWEWANHGLKTKTKDGEEYYGYGGDFGDEPNDYNFVMDGVLFSDHTPAPGLIEYQKAIEPVQVEGYSNGHLKIVNRYDIIGLDHLTCDITLVGDGMKRAVGQVQIPSPVQPHQCVILALPEIEIDGIDGEIQLQVDFKLRKDTNWASAGHVVSCSQVQLRGPVKKVVAAEKQRPAPTLFTTNTKITVRTEVSTWKLDAVSGKLTSWIKNGVELVHNGLGPELDFYRALTDNDRPQDGSAWKESFLHLTKVNTRSIAWQEPKDGSVSVVVTSRVAPPVLSWSIDTTTTYTFSNTGSLHIYCAGKPQGMNLPPTLARVGFTFAMPKAFDTVTWFGRGPGESYKDKKMSQQFGNWESTVTDLFVDYDFPQETSNRTDVRWVKFSTTPAISKVPLIGDMLLEKVGQLNIGGRSTSLTAKFGTQPGFSFMASNYTTTDLDESTHPYELHKKKRDYVIVRLDADHHGLGTGSCGPKTLEQYALKTKEFEFEIELE